SPEEHPWLTALDRLERARESIGFSRARESRESIGFSRSRADGGASDEPEDVRDLNVPDSRDEPGETSIHSEAGSSTAAAPVANRGDRQAPIPARVVPPRLVPGDLYEPREPATAGKAARERALASDKSDDT